MFIYPKNYDVIVVGGGHAGIEAALASARMGCRTLLLSMNLDSVGQMSCNPAIGGLGKGNLVREIDALGGEMARTTDMTGLQFRMLNRRKGPSVWAPRAQCDKKAYQLRMKTVCERQSNLDLKQGQVASLISSWDRAAGVETTQGIAYSGTAVVLTTGTFLMGLIHVGSNQQPGGRAGEAAAAGLSGELTRLGLELGRFKTGTPPRLLGSSIDFGKTEVQQGDEPIPFMSSWMEDLFHVERREPGCNLSAPNRASFPIGSVLAAIGRQLHCHLTYTTPKTAEIVCANLDRSPLYAGAIRGIGPRYCPSIEDKIVKFPQRERHQIFLEPEGVATDEIYVNGLSTSLPLDVQFDLVRTIVGCEHAEIMRSGYAIEYDYVPPHQITASMETKCLQNLFLAGQINGTSGYEEAAAQGLMAGINAARRAQGKGSVVLGRDQAYIGVMIDDLVTKDISEPYRMFTSMAEYRILLRQDNADLRLSETGFEIGLLPKRKLEIAVNKRRLIKDELDRLAVTRHGSMTLEEILRRPEVSYRGLPQHNSALSDEVIQQVEVETKYRGYIERQLNEVRRLGSMEEKGIPHWIDYTRIPGLRNEAIQKLQKCRPSTIGQALRLSGVTPADVSLLSVWLRRTPQVDAKEEKISPDLD